MIIVELSSGCRRQPTVGGADSSVGPVTHIISPDHSLQLFHSVVLRLVLTAVEQLFFHSCTHTFTACIVHYHDIFRWYCSCFEWSHISLQQHPGIFSLCNARVENKFNAFKEYAKKYNLHWGFVRDIDEELYINNTIYTEDMSGDNWIPLDDVLK